MKSFAENRNLSPSEKLKMIQQIFSVAKIKALKDTKSSDSNQAKTPASLNLSSSTTNSWGKWCHSMPALQPVHVIHTKEKDNILELGNE